MYLHMWCINPSDNSVDSVEKKSVKQCAKWHEADDVSVYEIYILVVAKQNVSLCQSLLLLSGRGEIVVVLARGETYILPFAII